MNVVLALDLSYINTLLCGYIPMYVSSKIYIAPPSCI